MAKSITVTLPDDVKQSLEQVAQAEGVTPDELIGRAIKQHLFLQRFRSLRERMSAKAQKHGILTDQDVFDHVS